MSTDTTTAAAQDFNTTAEVWAYLLASEDNRLAHVTWNDGHNVRLSHSGDTKGQLISPKGDVVSYGFGTPHRWRKWHRPVRRILNTIDLMAAIVEGKTVYCRIKGKDVRYANVCGELTRFGERTTTASALPAVSMMDELPYYIL